MRLYPKPGMLTHISRGMDNMPAVFVNGSIVSRIIVSERGALVSRSRASNPIMRTVIRLAPSQAGGKSDSGTEIGGGKSSTLVIGVPSSVVITGPLFSEVTVPQEAGGVPGNGVILQQVMRPRTRKKPPRAKRMAIAQKT